MKKLILASLVLSSVAFGAPTADVDILQQVESYSLALDNTRETGKAMAWDLIRFRTVLEGGISVPVLASFSILPEIEFHFVKK